MSNKNTKKLKVFFDPSEIFETIKLPIKFESEFSLDPIYIFKNSNPSYEFQKTLKCKNITRRKPFLYRVENAYLYGQSNLIATKQNQTSFFGLVFSQNPNKIFAGEIDNFKSHNDGLEVSYTDILHFKDGFFIGGSINFGHWLFNCIGRLNYLKFLDKNIPIIVHEYVPQRFLDCISYFSSNPVIKIPKGSLCIFENVFVGTTSWFIDEKNTYWWNENLVKFLNYKFTKDKKITSKRSIFLSRENTNWRQISNEKIIYDQLKKISFEKIYIETLPIDDQINLALESKFIIAPIGASTCTYLFSNILTKCVTLTPNIYSPMFCIELYCGPLQLPHKWILGDIDKDKKNSINSDYLINENLDWENILSKF